MVTAIAGMVDPVRVPEITAAVSRTRASVLLASDCIYDSELLRCPSRKRFAREMSETPYEVCEFVTARNDASRPAALHEL